MYITYIYCILDWWFSSYPNFYRFSSAIEKGEHFIGIILLPIVGNACEHAAAVRFAMQEIIPGVGRMGGMGCEKRRFIGWITMIIVMIRIRTDKNILRIGNLIVPSGYLT